MRIEATHIKFMLGKLDLSAELRAKLESALAGRSALTLDDADTLREMHVGHDCHVAGVFCPCETLDALGHLPGQRLWKPNIW